MNNEMISTRKRRYFAGASLEQALVLAARYHALDPTEISYRKLEKRHGFVKTPRRVILEVDPSSPRRRRTDESVSRPSVTRPERPTVSLREPPRPPVAPEVRSPTNPPVQAPGVSTPIGGDVLAEAREATERVLHFAGLRLKAEVGMEGGELLVELSGEGRELLLEDEAEVLLAIEHLIPRVLAGGYRDSLGCRADSEGFRSGRERVLQQLALTAAEEVRSTGRPVKLDPLSPPERRQIHMVLADVPGVATESEGDGHFKRVVIRPA